MRTTKHQIQDVFNHWNTYKNKGCFRGHNKPSPEIERAIRLRLKDYSVGDLCKAITNYAEVLIDSDYGWTYPWTLQQFLTRHNPHYKDELQLYRWLENNFVKDRYLMPEVKQKRAQQKKKYKEKIMQATDEKIVKVYRERPDLRWLIDELRPELQKLMKDE